MDVVGSAQSGKSLIGHCWAAYSIGENPGSIGVYLPSIDDARKYAEEKIQAITDASPALRRRVRSVSSRSNEGSSTLRKRFTGGSLRIATDALQMVSFRDLILEEVASYEPDVGGRGSPIEQAKKRRSWRRGPGAESHALRPCRAAPLRGPRVLASPRTGRRVRGAFAFSIANATRRRPASSSGTDGNATSGGQPARSAVCLPPAARDWGPARGRHLPDQLAQLLHAVRFNAVG